MEQAWPLPLWEERMKSVNTGPASSVFYQTLLPCLKLVSPIRIPLLYYLSKSSKSYQVCANPSFLWNPPAFVQQPTIFEKWVIYVLFSRIALFWNLHCLCCICIVSYTWNMHTTVLWSQVLFSWFVPNIVSGTHRCLNRFYQSWNFQSRCQEQFCHPQISE